jgi:hypothetical protein
LKHRASTKVPCGEACSLPVHALVANFVDAAQGNQDDPSRFIPTERFDEYWARISEIAAVLKRYHADFNSINKYGHSPISELQHEASWAPARKHTKYRDFCKLISDSSAMKLTVEAVIPAQPAEDDGVAAFYDHLRRNPRLPDHTSQSISELVWSEKSSDWTPVLCFGHTPNNAIYFNAAALELKLRLNDTVPISLVLCNWPQDCSANDVEPRVQWQWLRPKPVDLKPEDDAHKFITRGTTAPAKGPSERASGGWLPIEDVSILHHLQQRASLIESNGQIGRAHV